MAKSLTSLLSCCLLLSMTAAAQPKSKADSALKFFSVRSNISYSTPEWQLYIDSALVIDSTVATLWQWKGMPYFKNSDYAEGLRCYEKAVFYDPVRYLPLRAFMKATFLKDYEGAISEFMECKEKGYGVGLMDHSYDFFLAICYKETGDLDKADNFLSKSVNDRIAAVGDNWVHWNEWFFMGVICYQKQQYGKAMTYFDKCLREYKGYPSALYYKGLSLVATGKKEEARALFTQAIENINKGMRSSEDNDMYVNYPNVVYAADVEAAIKDIY